MKVNFILTGRENTPLFQAKLPITPALHEGILYGGVLYQVVSIVWDFESDAHLSSIAVLVEKR